MLLERAKGRWIEFAFMTEEERRTEIRQTQLGVLYMYSYDYPPLERPSPSQVYVGSQQVALTMHCVRESLPSMA